ncbi:recombination protein NinG [Pantoea sp. T14]|uniref:recombination protein NinG n=1 Tax=Pantoea sp. T14 TaxID=3085685 RepID=UPI003FA76B0D
MEQAKKPATTNPEHCNSYLSGNIGKYQLRLIEKIGQAAFDRLMGPLRRNSPRINLWLCQTACATN